MAELNPLAAGLGNDRAPGPCGLVILGAAGDLTRRKLLPALWNLELDGALPASFFALGFSRDGMSQEAFRSRAREEIGKYSRRPLDAARGEAFGRRLFYQPGVFDDAASYAELGRKLQEIERTAGVPGGRVFYLAVPPDLVPACVGHLKAAGLSGPSDGPSFSRVIVEKPIGRDLESARLVNRALLSHLDERQVFRIDHYLGKETVQNILVFRFANSIFEPIWNEKHIDHVQITVAEEEGVGTRANYYDEAGALRDMVQNHILQLVCLTAMEPPWSTSADAVRDHKLEVLQCLRPPNQVSRSVVRAQYGPGFVRGEPVPGYLQERGVSPDSTTETFVALELFVDNWRWSGVPFYVRTGKRLPKRATEIAVEFKKVPQELFESAAAARPALGSFRESDPARPAAREPHGNVLALNIQPDEGLSLRILTKLPGPRARTFPVKMDFRYGGTFGDQAPEAYERLLLDVMTGDATLFMRRDAVEASWAWVTGILEAWKGEERAPLPEYASGTWGPPHADRLIGAGGRKWRTL